jgi:hypothetical protein
MSRSKWITLFLFLLCFSAGAETKLNREKWKELRDGIHYRKSADSEEYFEEWSKKTGNPDQFENRKDTREYLEGKEREYKPSKKNKPSSFTFPGWIMYILYAAIAIVLLFIIYKLFFDRPKKIQITKTAPVEEELPVEKPFDELEEMLKTFIEKGNYREAIRIYFIFIIKTLRNKGWIQWEKQKTNRHYLAEMRERNEFQSFSKSILLFEIIWYGKRDVNAEQFAQIRIIYDDLLTQLRNKQ